MSVLTYLQSRASAAVLSSTETNSISTSISTMKSRLEAHFGTGISSTLLFGSYTRGTILPRRMDARSDVDYMVVFSEGGYKPQTYLDRLKRFVEAKYSTSELYQSNPTVVLELNHIKFELVPALAYWGSYQIPNGPNEWQTTNPNEFNTTLTNKNAAEGYYLKPAIRLAKYWNASAGYVFGSYLLEKWIVEQWFSNCNSIKDYLFAIIDKMAVPAEAQWRKDKVERAKEIVKNVRIYEAAAGFESNALAEIKKLIPE